MIDNWEIREKLETFLLQKWQERAKELNREVPTTLENSCKFVSLFIHKLFGGKLQGNSCHQYVVLENGHILDPTKAIGLTAVNAYKHDPEFWGNEEHEESMKSCLPRVEKWIEEWCNQNDSVKS